MDAPELSVQHRSEDSVVSIDAAPAGGPLGSWRAHSGCAAASLPAAVAQPKLRSTASALSVAVSETPHDPAARILREAVKQQVSSA